MGGKYTKYEDTCTYEIRPKDIIFPEDEDSDFDTVIVDHSKQKITVPVVVSYGRDIDTVIVDHSKQEITVPVVVSDGSDIDTVIVDYTKPEMTVSVSDGKRT